MQDLVRSRLKESEGNISGLNILRSRQGLDMFKKVLHREFYHRRSGYGQQKLPVDYYAPMIIEDDAAGVSTFLNICNADSESASGNTALVMFIPEGGCREDFHGIAGCPVALTFERSWESRTISVRHILKQAGSSSPGDFRGSCLLLWNRSECAATVEVYDINRRQLINYGFQNRFPKIMGKPGSRQKQYILSFTGLQENVRLRSHIVLMNTSFSVRQDLLVFSPNILDFRVFDNQGYSLLPSRTHRLEPFSSRTFNLGDEFGLTDFEGTLTINSTHANGDIPEGNFTGIFYHSGTGLKDIQVTRYKMETV